MNVAKQLLMLAEIGLLDQKISNQNVVLKKVPFKAEVAKQQAQELQNKKNDLQSQARKLQKEKKHEEHELDDEKQNLRKWEQRAEKIRGEREFAALMSEIGAKKRLISNTENLLLEKMVGLEETDKQVAKTLEAFENAHACAQKEWSEVKEEMSSLEKQLKEEKETRAKLIDKLPASTALRYKKISAQRAGKGVAFLQREVCQCCKRMVPPELFLKVAKGEVVEQCPSCQRLLVVMANSYFQKAK